MDWWLIEMKHEKQHASSTHLARFFAHTKSMKHSHLPAVLTKIARLARIARIYYSHFINKKYIYTYIYSRAEKSVLCVLCVLGRSRSAS